MKKFKEEDLILYLYQDCSPRLTSAIESAAAEDITLKDQLERLRRTISQLDKLRLKSPSKRAIKAILKHAETGRGKNLAP